MAKPAFRILIVDDNADAAMSMQILLLGEGYEAKAAFTGQAALEEAARFRPDMMLIDLGMPVMDGIELVTRCRNMPELNGSRLVAVTSYGKELIPTPSPFDQYIQKPVDTVAFLRYLAVIAG